MSRVWLYDYALITACEFMVRSSIVYPLDIAENGCLSIVAILDPPRSLGTPMYVGFQKSSLVVYGFDAS